MPDKQSSTGNPTGRIGAAWGVFLILVGLLLNKWCVERVFAADEYISVLWKVAVIIAFQLCWIVPGLWCLLARPAMAIPTYVRRAATLVLVAAVAFGLYGNAIALGIIDPNREFHESVRTMVESEDLMLELSVDLKDVAKSAMNLQLPDHKSRHHFEREVTLVDLGPGAPSSYKELLTVRTAFRKWEVESNARKSDLNSLSIWSRFLEEIQYFEHAKFYPIRGRFLDGAKNEYEADVGFSGLARMASGQWGAVKASQKICWRKHPAPEGTDKPLWRIYDWQTESLKTIETQQRLFEDVLDEAIRDPNSLARARNSIHEQFVIQQFLDKKFKKPNKYFARQSWDRHPGISVVDIDRDGDDDLYIMARWGKNMLLRNLGDGTFDEIASDVGLDIEGHTSCAIFADFDNDGDPDAFLGRTLAPSMLLINEGGRFVDRTASLTDEPLPYLASSVSAVDYNADGLLDIYVSTYAAELISRDFYDPKRTDDRLLGEFLPEQDARELFRRLRLADYQRFANRPGPPNVLLKNLGGRFERATDVPELFLFKNTYQSTWADYDDDGDPDIYCASDFAPNNLFRNDGDGKFVEVTDQTETADIGFGMGASWGDYDLDGKQDLYVSNMFSKAGRRITAQVPGLNPKFADMARGNSLLRNLGERFEKVSGSHAPAMMVEIAGWSWGSQFVDVDNDSYLDVFALSGYYSAPKQIAIPRDT